MLFSPFFVSWHVLVVRAVLWSSAPIALVQCPINRFLRGTGGSDFFYRFSFHLILSLGCLLTDLLFATRLLAYPYRPAPRPATLDTEDGEGMDCDVGGGGGLMTACLLM